MKDFINWLRNNEKIGKVIVWLFIITIGLIILNITLESLGLPHYSITTNELFELSTGKIMSFILDCLICLLNFYAIVLLVFRVKEAKRIIIYAIIYMILDYIILITLGYVALQVYIFIYCSIFCYFYSNKKLKYALYGLLAILVNILVQGIWYNLKIKFIDYSSLSGGTLAILSIDYFIIMAIIILVKEIYLQRKEKKYDDTKHNHRRTRARKPSMARPIQPRKEISKKNINKSN